MLWLFRLGALLAGIALSLFAVRSRLRRIDSPDSASGLKLGWPLLAPAGIYAALLLGALPRFIHWIGEFHTHWALDLAVISGDYFVPIATACIAWIGWLDDRHGLSGRHKLIVLLSAWALVTIPLALSQWTAPALFRSGGMERDLAISIKSRYDALSLAFATLFGVGLTLALPLIDGLNGLFLGTVGVAFLHFWHAVAYQRGIAPIDGTTAGLLVVFTLGILLGLFLGNFPRGRIRLPEAVVLPLAFLTGLAATTALRTTPPGIDWPIFNSEHAGYEVLQKNFALCAVIILSPLLFPLVDLAFVSINRVRHSRSAFAGGHDHLHHRLLQSGLSPVRTALALIGASAMPVLSVAGLLLMREDGWRKRWYWIDWHSYRHPALPGLNIFSSQVLLTCVLGLLPLTYLFWRGYAKVDPYQSGAVDERGRP